MGFLMAFVFHAVLSLYLTFFPVKNLGSSPVAKFYQYFVRLGPFFNQDRLQHYRHFVVALKSEGVWREIDLTQKEVSGYQENILAFNHLTRRDFLQHNAREFYTKGKKKNSEAFRKLHEFVRVECFSDSQPDSVRWLFKKISSSPGVQSAEEVIFIYDYAPTDAEKP